MYIPPIFNDSTLEEVKDFIERNSFGILINQKEGRSIATHIPLIQSTDTMGQEILYGHISKANEQWQTFHLSTEVLVIFLGPHSYISPSWYVKENVPTWNYVAVHIYGRLSLISEEELLHSLELLVEKYEKIAGTNLKMEDFSDQLMKRELRGIVGFKIQINQIQASFKLSQNRDDESYQNIISALNTSEIEDHQRIAEYMSKRRSPKN